ELDPDADGRVEITLGLRTGPGDAERLRITGFGGVHPVVVELSDDGGTTERFATFVVRVPDQVENQLGLALVQPLPTEPAIRPDGSTVLDDATRAILTNADAIFGRAPDVPVTFQLSPETLSALSGSAEPLDEQLL